MQKIYMAIVVAIAILIGINVYYQNRTAKYQYDTYAELQVIKEEMKKQGTEILKNRELIKKMQGSNNKLIRKLGDIEAKLQQFNYYDTK